MSARNRFPVFMLQSGMRFEPDERGNYTLADTRLIDSLDVCKEILGMKNVFPATLSASDADAERLFLQGKVSIIMTTYAGLNYFKDADFSFDIAPVPYSHEYRTLMIIIGLAINRKSKVKDAAKLLSDFLTSYEAQLLIRKRTLSIPANKSAAEWKGLNDSNNSPSRYHMFRELIPTFRLSTDLLLSPSDLNIVLREAKLYWSGLHDKDTMCRNIEEALSESSKVKAGG
jgi:multiple sugar transport system substrate-binding protein